jgi:prepilin-type N-terminal cleavage/methylation domain-containing protein
MTPSKRGGFTLIELLVAMAVLVMLLSMSVAIILAMLRNHETDVAFGQRLATQEDLAERFRTDVASAGAAPPRAGEFVASSRCLILRQPSGKLLVYRMAVDGLERIEETQTRLVRLGNERASIEFERGDGRLLTLRWVETRGSEAEPVRHALEFSAALGGDLR